MKKSLVFVSALLSLSLAACGGGAGNASGNGTGPAADAAPTFTALAGDHTFTFVIPEGATAERLVDLAKAHCGARGECRVYGWRDAAQVPSRLPFSDTDRTTMAFEHIINRAQDNFERSLFDCAVYPQADTGACFIR